MEADLIDVEVAYATPHRQELQTLKVSQQATIEDVIEHSGILGLFPEIDLSINKVGIFGQVASLDTVLEQGDRVEIYRPLVNDPRLARQQRVRQSRKAN
ncbi:MAG: RnfH family protein [Gammaproteobacteria bacterium]|nr:RnfH family protein [Gammaproteobacteria bacterium]